MRSRFIALGVVLGVVVLLTTSGPALAGGGATTTVAPTTTRAGTATTTTTRPGTAVTTTTRAVGATSTTRGFATTGDGSGEMAAAAVGVLILGFCLLRFGGDRRLSPRPGK